VERAAQEVNYHFSGLKTPQNSGDTYGLGYTDFVVPLVKAVQELNTENSNLKAEIADLKAQLHDQTNAISSLQSAQTNTNKEFAALRALISDKAEVADGMK